MIMAVFVCPVEMFRPALSQEILRGQSYNATSLMVSNHFYENLRNSPIKTSWPSNRILERTTRMATRGYAVFVKTVKPVPIQNPKVGSGIAKSIDERTTIFLKRITG